MEISIALFVLIGVTVIVLWTHISEIHAKLDILLQNNDIKWEQYFTDEIINQISQGKVEKAAMTLRRKTGLSLKSCSAVINKFQTKNA